MERAATEKDVTDESLMSDLASGQQDAIGLLYARYAPTILGMAAQALGRPTAEDIVQDVFLAVWKNAPTYDPKPDLFGPGCCRSPTRSLTNCAAEADIRRSRPTPTVSCSLAFRNPGQVSPKKSGTPTGSRH
jgi:RNA polymerase sigma-70 factor (ECF subfamily)